MRLRSDDRRALRARLDWMRLLGIEEVTMRRAVGEVPERPGPLPPDSAVAVQVGLFGGEEVVAGPGPSGRRAPGTGRSAEENQSPLAGLQALEPADPAISLGRLREDIGDCRLCRLCEKRTQIVFGVGNPRARLLFIGEGPGVDEDRQGEPFVGRAGQLLTRIIESMGLARDDVYIANVVKCRPPENRTPRPDEIATCSPFLFQQVAMIRPRVIVCLGTPAAQTVLGTRATITTLRGTLREVGKFHVMPTFHPAYLLRNPAAKKEVWEDMKKVMALLKAEG